MKVAVITRHAITNYGSLLQALATQKAIENLGYECKIIDYIREDESCKNLEKTLVRRKPEWNNSLIKKSLYLCLRQPECLASGVKFEKERKKYLNLTSRYKTEKELYINPPKADVYVTGSDQVWGPTTDGTSDSCYCLSFTEKRKISYAASFGKLDVADQLSQYYQNWLSKYSCVTVREDSAVELLKKINIDSKQVLDPTLLFDATFWSKLATPIKEKNYILIYQLHNNPKLGEYAKIISKETGLKIIRISVAYHQVTRLGKFVWCPSVGEFLSYVKNARYMLTDSFHGTAFSINFNTQFIEVLPNNNTGTRNISILKLTGLVNRVVNDDNIIELIKNDIDFSYVNSILESERSRSWRILEEMLTGNLI